MGKARTPQQKDKNQKQRAMQRKIYERLNEEERKEFIKTRQAQSQEATRERKAKIALIRECVKKGVEYARKNHEDIMLFYGHVGYSLSGGMGRVLGGVPVKGYGVSAAAILQTDPATGASFYKVAYALRKPSDHYSHRMATGLAAYRVMPEVQHPYQFKIGLTAPGGVSLKRMRAIIEAHIHMDALSARVKIPPQIGRAIVNDHAKVMLKDASEKKKKKTAQELVGKRVSQ